MTEPEILVIDDEPAIRKLLEITLESNGYRVRLAENGKTGIQLAANHPPELILLDIGLPDMGGLEVLKTLKAWYNKSILILSVQNDESTIVEALDLGASDYITKPFRSGELMARIRSSIKRHDATDVQSQLKCGDLSIDLHARSVKRGEELIKLTNTEYNLLALMVRNEGRVLTHQYLLKEIWGVGFQHETQYLRVFVGNLRKKIEVLPNQPQHIITESGVGYRFR